MYQNKTLIAVVGPTAVGKTSLSIALAKAFHTEIISCDSRQFYKEMTVGTAVPNQMELDAIKHHFIQDRSIQDSYDVGNFEKEALQVLDCLFQKHSVIIMVGGSALYEKAVTHGLDKFPTVPPLVLEKLQEELDKDGLIPLANELETVDPEYAKIVDIQNARRVIRALSIYRTTNIPYSQYLGKSKGPRGFKIIKVGLQAPREELYERINLRVDHMMENGLMDEAQNLLEYKHYPILKTVGYQELFPYLKGEYDLEEAVRLIKRNSRRLAKRQLTWYRKDKDVIWFSYKTHHTKIVQWVKQLIMKS